VVEPTPLGRLHSAGLVQEYRGERLGQHRIKLRCDFLDLRVVIWAASVAFSVRLPRVRKRPGGRTPPRVCCSWVLPCSRIDFMRRCRPTWSDALITLFPFRGKPSETAQSFGHLHAPADASDYHVDHGKGRVEVAASVELVDRHTRSSQRFGVSDTLVAKQIEFAGRHEGLRQALEFAAQWRDARIGSVARRTVQVPEPVHQRARQKVARRIVVVRRAVESAVGDWAHQSWPEICGPPRSRANWQVTAAMLPPALQPAFWRRKPLGAPPP
jgi:hypothetical protein